MTSSARGGAEVVPSLLALAAGVSNEMADWRRLPAEFASGWIGGAAGVAASHPLDTARVRIQIARPGEDVRLVPVLLECAQKEGVKGLFRGIASPLVCVGLWKATIFAGKARVAIRLHPWARRCVGAS